MLTESERAWLKDRRNKAYCRYCRVIDLCSNPNASGFKCPLIPDYKEAAEFEALVAAKLAVNENVEDNLKCLGFWATHWADCDVRKNGWNCADCYLKAARLAVEEEMDADRK